MEEENNEEIEDEYEEKPREVKTYGDPVVKIDRW